MPTIKPPENRPHEVDTYMDRLDHPLKAEVEAVRQIIKGVHAGITEQIKWNAPSFGYKEHLATFNLHARQHVHLVFHNGAVLSDTSGLLQGNYPDRRMAYFTDMADVLAQKPALEKVVKVWIALMDKDPEA
jgi:hypothetical protein